MKKLTVFITVVFMACLVGGVIFVEDKIKVDNIRTKLRKTAQGMLGSPYRQL